jgi:hypothetical protein
MKADTSSGGGGESFYFGIFGDFWFLFVPWGREGREKGRDG